MTAPPSAQVHEFLIRTHQPYEAVRFVDRDRELSYVREQVRLIQEQGFALAPLINFWGVKGIGKTWMLHHLHHLYSYSYHSETAQLNPTFATLYSVHQSQNYILSDMVQQVSASILAQIGSNLQVEERSLLNEALHGGTPTQMVAAINRLTGRFVPVLLFDNTEGFQPGDWQEFGRSFVEPLVTSSRVLIVITGRREAPRWSRFDVRNRLLSTERTRLSSFSRDAVRNQVSRAGYSLKGELVDLIFPFTAGTPQLVDAIARHLLAWSVDSDVAAASGVWIERYRPLLIQILAKALDDLLENVPDQLLQPLEVVAPLRFYRLEALRTMLAQDGGERRADGYYHQLLRELDQRTEVVWWERAKRAYVTSDVVRQVMNRRQLLADPGEYTRQHEAALQMYQHWIDAFPQASEEFIVENVFHLACLYLAHNDAAHFQQQATAQIAFANKSLNLERFHILQQQLEGDREIFDLAPRQVYQQIVTDLNTLLTAKTQG